MPVPPQDRPLTAVREETIDRLIVNYGHGKLSLEAFERRLDEALDARPDRPVTGADEGTRPWPSTSMTSHGHLRVKYICMRLAGATCA